MTTKLVTDHIKSSTVFREVEITPDKVKLISNKALMTFNRYVPKIIRSSSQLIDSNFSLLRSPLNVSLTGYDPFFTDPYIYIYSTNWSLDTIDDSPYISYFYDLLEAYSYMYLSNPRRTTATTELPIDMKGDQFYTEGSQKLTDTETVLQGLSDGAL